jgi:hypothetical protein
MPLHYIDPNEERGRMYPEKRNPNMKTRVLIATVGTATAALAAGVMWTAPSASADTPYCDGLRNPQQVHECNCGFDFAPGTQELHDCLYGSAAPTPKP